MNPFDSSPSEDQPGPYAGPFSSPATPSDAGAEQMSGAGTEEPGGPVENLQASLGALNVGGSQPVSYTHLPSACSVPTPLHTPRSTWRTWSA